MFYKNSNQYHLEALINKVRGICPNCKDGQLFESLNYINYDLTCESKYFGPNHELYYDIAGIRVCPSCKMVVHFEGRRFDDKEEVELYKIYPYRIRETKAKHVPDTIKYLLNESYKCYYFDCKTAAGMLIRKTLESICDDQGAEGNNLHRKIENLKTKMTIAEALYNEMMGELKLFGNDATHIKSKDYENLDDKTLELAFLIIESILKSLYEDREILNEFKSFKKRD